MANSHIATSPRNENHILRQRNMPDSTGWVEVRNVVYIQFTRFIQRIAGQYVRAQGINREHEVGNRHRYDVQPSAIAGIA
jgi:hypothetical protein